MTLKWLPNALTLLRCVLAFLVGWSIWSADQIIAFNAAMELSALSLQSTFSEPYTAAQTAQLTAHLERIRAFEASGVKPIMVTLPFLLFTITALTDLLDGYLARKLDAVSKFGALLDPIADKLLVAIGLLGICFLTHWAMIWIVPTLLIISRDAFVTALRFRGRVSLPVSGLSKWKTAAEMLAIGAFLFAFALPDVAGFLSGTDTGRMRLDLSPSLAGVLGLALVMAYISAALSVWTGRQYAAAFFGSSKF